MDPDGGADPRFRGPKRETGDGEASGETDVEEEKFAPRG